MPELRLVTTATLGSLSTTSTVSRTSDGELYHEVTLPAGKAGNLTTRTSDTEGVLTLGANHGITTNDMLTVSWAGGTRCNVDVSAADATTVTIQTGAGDNLPADETAIVAAVSVSVDCQFDGADVAGMVARCDQDANMAFIDTTPQAAIDLEAAEAWCWYSDGPGTNTLAALNVTALTCGNRSTTAATLKFALLLDSV